MDHLQGGSGRVAKIMVPPDMVLRDWDRIQPSIATSFTTIAEVAVGSSPPMGSYSCWQRLRSEQDYCRTLLKSAITRAATVDVEGTV